MIPEGSLAAYKNRPALVKGISDGRIEIAVPGGEVVRVREKDLSPLHPGTLAGAEELDALCAAGAGDAAGARDAWELLLGENRAVSLKELAELLCGDFTPRTAWAAYRLLAEGLYFSGEPGAVVCRSASEVEAREKRLQDKKRDADEREAGLALLRRGGAISGEEAAGPARRVLQEIEALALGRTDKSRALRELGITETPQEAHRLLLTRAVWPQDFNPHPPRFGKSLSSAASVPPPPDEAEARADLTALPAFAIDNPWSADPDDAVSLEERPDGRRTLWVHVADLAASVLPGSPADIEARTRGSTLYLPEGTARMLSPKSLPLFALGLSPVSLALSFKLVLNSDCSIAETEIIPSRVKVTRMTYADADNAAGSAPFAGLFALANENIERRLNSGAVFIDFPDTHITIDNGKVHIEQVPFYKSAEMVRECMVLAGEGAAKWAIRNKVPFPFVSQEAGELPETRLPGLAGAFQMRRCMRPRGLSVKPGVHWGLGLDAYTQVTSPLRRYTDLLAHEQARAVLRGALPLSEEETLLRVSAAEAAAQAAVKAERASKAHWVCVYLVDKIDSVWEAVVLERRGARAIVRINALGLETQAAVKGEPNERVPLTLKSVDIPTSEAVFV
ncbi:MAG: ribonuclease II family protein [Treponematales bacterium]